MSFARKLERNGMRPGLRRHRWTHDELILRPKLPLLWLPASETCDKCLSAYPLDEQRHVREQLMGQFQAGPRCYTCGHCIKREELVEYHDKKNEVALLIQCHGDEELHILDLGTVEWQANEANPDDTLYYVRSMRMAVPAFMPNSQGERGLVQAST